jgi:hypothetical protein
LSFACGGGEDDGEVTPGGKGGSAKGGSGGKGGKGGSTAKGGSGGSDVQQGGKGGSPMGGDGGSTQSGGSAGGGGEEPSEGLIGYWNFDEGTGTAVKDSSPNGNNGTLVAGLQDALAQPVAAPMWSDGKKGKAISLNGVDQWIRVPRSDSIDSTGQSTFVSVAAWVNFKEVTQATANSQYNFVLNRQEVGTAYEHFGLGLHQGKATAAIHFFFTTSATPMELNKWVHLAMSYDGITAKTYVDGVEVATQDIGWTIAADSTPITIGGAQNLDVIKEFVSGQIDELHLFNTALTPDQVKGLMNK